MRLHLVDGTYELFRYHYSKLPDREARDGTSVKGTVGVVSSMLALLRNEDEAVTHLAVAFDNPIRSFRNDLFAGYKSDAGVPEEISAQFDLVEAGMAAIGVTYWSMVDFEADDGLAAAAARWRHEVDQVRIMTPDKDLGQCIRGDRVVQVDRRREKVTDEATLRETKGIGPLSVPDYLGLVGDTADGIPGLPRFGAKSTAALLGHYRHIEDIPADHSTWAVKVRGAAKLSEILNANREAACLYRKLAVLREDAPLPQKSLDELRWRGVPRAKFLAWCDQMGAKSLRQRPHRWAD